MTPGSINGQSEGIFTTTSAPISKAAW